MKYTEIIEHSNNINNKLMSNASKVILLKHRYLVSKLQITIHQKPGFVEIHARIADIDKWLNSISRSLQAKFLVISLW